MPWGGCSEMGNNSFNALETAMNMPEGDIFLLCPPF
jgi:hypothetical protein